MDEWPDASVLKESKVQHYISLLALCALTKAKQTYLRHAGHPSSPPRCWPQLNEHLWVIMYCDPPETWCFTLCLMMKYPPNWQDPFLDGEKEAEKMCFRDLIYDFFLFISWKALRRILSFEVTAVIYLIWAVLFLALTLDYIWAFC